MAAKTSKQPTYTKPPPEMVYRKRDSSLTDREKDVLAAYARGMTYEETGEELGISPKTVGSYLQRVREKCRAKTKADVIAFALSEGLFEVEGGPQR